jgi:uncharacterized protein (TIGR03118 family)
MRHHVILALGLAVTACGAADVDASDSESQAEEIRASKVVQAMDVTNLVADTAGAARRVDANLKNAWGIAFNPTNGAAWVSNAGTGTSTVYDATGKLLLTVAMPAKDGPTAQVFNGSTNFHGDKFITVSESGNIMGWSGGTTASVRAHSSAANYKGAAIAGDKLYVANFKTGKVDVYGSNYQPITVAGGFADASMPSGFAPFNVWEYEGFLFVSYAKPDADAKDDVKGPGNGFINVFDADGHRKQRLLSHGALNSPWGMTIATEQLGKIAKETLLVANFGDGRVNTYALSDAPGGGFKASSKGALGDAAGKPLSIDGLWAVATDSKNNLWFTAGPGGEEHGLVGRLSVHVAPPSTGGY